jgi:hypothetical protein
MFGLRKNHLTNLVKYEVKEEFLHYQSARIIEGGNSNCVTSSCGNSASKIVLAHVAY